NLTAVAENSPAQHASVKTGTRTAYPSTIERLASMSDEPGCVRLLEYRWNGPPLALMLAKPHADTGTRVRTDRKECECRRLRENGNSLPNREGGRAFQYPSGGWRCRRIRRPAGTAG